MKTDVALSEEQRTALVKLAFYVAETRGLQTICGRTVDELLAPSEHLVNVVCPLTLNRGPPEVYQSYVLPPYDDYCPEAPPHDFLAQMLGLLPFDFWRCQREKVKLSNLLHVDTRLRSPMEVKQGTFTPSLQQLTDLIVELEDRAAEAIRSAGRDGTWSMSLEFGESTAITSIEIGSSQNSKVLHAHEYDWRAIGLQEELEVQDDRLPHGYTCHREIGRDSEPTEYRPPLPTFASFVSPAAAVISYVSMIYHWKVRPWRFTSEEKAYLDLAVYFCSLACITSGHGFAKVLATRPEGQDLPELDADVKRVAREHATDERHTRKFPSMEGPVAERTRKRARDEFDVSFNARPENIKRAEIDHEGLQSALLCYEAAVQQHTRTVVECFDGGRGFSLFELLRGWSAVYKVVDKTKAKTLERLREEARDAQNESKGWVREIVKRGLPQDE